MSIEKELLAIRQHPIHGVCFDGKQKPPRRTPYSLEVSAGNVSLEGLSEIWSLKDSGERYTSTVRLFKSPTQHILSVDCEGRGHFCFYNDRLVIDGCSKGTGPSHYLQTLGLSLYLELRGHLCLHANTMVNNDNAFLFLAPSRTGKSTLTTAMTSRGYSLTTDDMACIYEEKQGYCVYPSWPKVRLWPDSEAYLNDSMSFDKSGTKKVHERFAKHEIVLRDAGSEKAAKVKGLYFLRREENYTGKTKITLMPTSKAMILLLQNSMLGDAYKSLGIDKTRFTRLADLIKNVPVFEVLYPSGLEHLEAVCADIHDDLKHEAFLG